MIDNLRASVQVTNGPAITIALKLQSLGVTWAESYLKPIEGPKRLLWTLIRVSRVPVKTSSLFPCLFDHSKLSVHQTKLTFLIMKRETLPCTSHSGSVARIFCKAKSVTSYLTSVKPNLSWTTQQPALLQICLRFEISQMSEQLF